MWSDKSRFTLFCTDIRLRFWQEPYDAKNPTCLLRSMQGFDGSIKIWSMFCWHESDTKTAMRYLDILADQVQCCLFTLMATNTSWMIIEIYILPKVFKIGLLSIIWTSNIFPGHLIARIVTILAPFKMWDMVVKKKSPMALSSSI
ncbi:hypothetical protein TNCV_923081 [Trichonephila clavipes]|nr:hypothetical protein TNCV_923081 [Trichonephila clavipes]